MNEANFQKVTDTVIAYGAAEYRRGLRDGLKVQEGETLEDVRRWANAIIEARD